VLSPAPRDPPLTAAEIDAALAPWGDAAILLAVSGGPDSMALAVAACDWRGRRAGPPVSAAVVDHGLRPDSAAAARTAAAQCAALGLPTRLLTWTGPKPDAALQERARQARYALLIEAACAAGAGVVMTAHHADDQAETILFRLLRGSGPSGLAGMAASSRREGVEIARPFLAFPKARLVATALERGLTVRRDPANVDPRFARARLRALWPALAREGATAATFARLAARQRRADAALDAATDALAAAARIDGRSGDWPLCFDAAAYDGAATELRLRLLGRAIVAAGGQTPRLDRLEALETRLAAYACADRAPETRLRLTLAGALIERDARRLRLRAAPPRRAAAPPAAPQPQAAGDE
jgi:tRNA(Ile)-lysidine synthase